jgi:hypothetical protein
MARRKTPEERLWSRIKEVGLEPLGGKVKRNGLRPSDFIGPSFIVGLLLATTIALWWALGHEESIPAAGGTAAAAVGEVFWLRDKAKRKGVDS